MSLIVFNLIHIIQVTDYFWNLFKFYLKLEKDVIKNAFKKLCQRSFARLMQKFYAQHYATRLIN